MIKNKNARKLSLSEMKELARFADENPHNLTVYNNDGDVKFMSYDAQAMLDLFHASCEFDYVDSWVEDNYIEVTGENLAHAKIAKIEASLLKRI